MPESKKATLQKFQKFCELLGIQPSELELPKERAVSESNATPDFSLTELRRLRVQFVEEQHANLNRLNLIEGWIAASESRTVSTANIQVLREVYRQEQNFARDVLGKIDLITTHSLPLILILKQLGWEHKSIKGNDLFRELSRYCAQHNKRVFLLGKQAESLARVREKLSEEFPHLAIVGCRCLQEAKSISTNEDLIGEINAQEANLVFVALPQPAQAIWLSEYSKKIKAVLVGVDETFYNFAEIFPASPPYIQKLGLEWLFQLAGQPYQFWRNYHRSFSTFLLVALKNQWRLSCGNSSLPLARSRRAGDVLDCLYRLRSQSNQNGSSG